MHDYSTVKSFTSIYPGPEMHHSERPFLGQFVPNVSCLAIRELISKMSDLGYALKTSKHLGQFKVW